MNDAEARRFALGVEWKERTLMDDPIMRSTYGASRPSPLSGSMLRVTRLNPTGAPIGKPVLTGPFTLTLNTTPVLGGKTSCIPVGTYTPGKPIVVTWTGIANAARVLMEGMRPAIAAAAARFAEVWMQTSMVKGMDHPLLTLKAPDRPLRQPERPCSVCGGRTVRRPRWSPRAAKGVLVATWDDRCQRCARSGYWPEALEVTPVSALSAHGWDDPEVMVTCPDECGWGYLSPDKEAAADALRDHLGTHVNLATMTGEGYGWGQGGNTPEDEHMADCEAWDGEPT